MNYPRLQDLLEVSDPEKILEVRRSLYSILSSFFLFLFAALVVILINKWLPGARLPFQLPVIGSPSARWLALIPAGVLIEILRKYHDDLYLFSLDKVTHLDGRLSLSYSVPTIKFAHIRAITIRQDIWGRIFDYGNVELETAAKDKAEVVIGGIRHPRALGRLIEELRRYNKALIPTDKEAGEAQSSNEE